MIKLKACQVSYQYNKDPSGYIHSLLFSHIIIGIYISLSVPVQCNIAPTLQIEGVSTCQEYDRVTSAHMLTFNHLCLLKLLSMSACVYSSKQPNHHSQPKNNYIKAHSIPMS